MNAGWKVGDECWATSPRAEDPAGEPRRGVIAAIGPERISVRVSEHCVCYYYDDTFDRLSRVAAQSMYQCRLIEKVPPSDPLDVLIDGSSLRELIAAADLIDREDIDPFEFDWAQWSDFSPAQRTAISAYRSAELRARIASGPSADAAAWRKSQQPQVWLDCAEEL